MRIAISSDEAVGVASSIREELERRGHEVHAHGALAPEERPDWAWASEAAAREVSEGRADAAVVCCWTGTGASIAANKVPGVRAALCGDAATAAGARKWNDANVLALSLRTTSEAELGEILDAWFRSEPSDDPDDRANIDRIGELERAGGGGSDREGGGDSPRNGGGDRGGGGSGRGGGGDRGGEPGTPRS